MDNDGHNISWNKMQHIASWRVKSTMFCVHRKVVLKNIMLLLSSQINNFSAHRNVVQKYVMSLLSSLKGQINKFLCAQERCAEIFMSLLVKPYGSNKQISLHMLLQCSPGASFGNVVGKRGWQFKWNILYSKAHDLVLVHSFN